MAIEITPPAVAYAAGSWTPTIIGSTTPGTQTYSTQVGRYRKFNDLVVATFTVSLTVLDGAAAGNAQIGGLPFASANDTAIWGGTLSTIINLTHAATCLEFGIRVAANVSVIGLFEFGQSTSGNTTAVPLTALLPASAATLLVGTIIYVAA